MKFIIPKNKENEFTFGLVFWGLGFVSILLSNLFSIFFYDTNIFFIAQGTDIVMKASASKLQNLAYWTEIIEELSKFAIACLIIGIGVFSKVALNQLRRSSR